MSTRIKAISAIYLSGFLQGVALVLYPAAGNIFTNDAYHGLSSTEFGVLFIPQIIFAILSSLSAPKLAEKYGMKKVLTFGLIANMFAMLCFAASVVCIGISSLPFWTLMLGTASLGAGFGFTITALNPFAFNLFPGKEASAVTGMHIFLGLGTTVSALLLTSFQNMGLWWGAGILVGIAFLGMLFFQMPIPLTLPKVSLTENEQTNRKTPFRVWLFAAAIFLYAFSEATFGNWGTIYLEQEAGLSVGQAALGLSIFWAAITAGRVIFTLLALKFNTKILYLIAPFLVAVVFFFLPSFTGATANLAAMAFGGLGLSFFFPYTISLATEEFPEFSAIVSGALVAAIQVGSGISTNITGVLNKTFSLGTIFQTSALFGILTGILVLYLHFSKSKDLSINK